MLRFTAFSLLVRPGGRATGRVGRWLEKSILRLTQPSYTGAWAELGNKLIIAKFKIRVSH